MDVDIDEQNGVGAGHRHDAADTLDGVGSHGGAKWANGLLAVHCVCSSVH